MPTTPPVFVAGQLLTDTQLNALSAGITEQQAAPAVQSGTVNATITSAAAGNAPLVTFTTPFATTPRVTATAVFISGSRAVVAGIVSVSTTGVTLRAAVMDGGTLTAAVTLHWVAVG